MKKARRKAPDWSKVKPLHTPSDHSLKPSTEESGWGLICAADVQPVAVEWLWKPYIPIGRISILEGDPGVGKSWITAAIAASVSTGEPLPGQEERHPPRRVLMLSVEDGLADTIVPRLQSMGADRRNIFFPAKHFTLDRAGVRGMIQTMRTCDATVVFIDPIVAYLGGKVDMHRANEVREVMTELAQAADKTNSAIIMVRHMRKASSNKAIYQGIGSIDFTAAVRSVMQVERGGDGDFRVLRHVKCTVEAEERRPLQYFIEDAEFRWGPFLDVETTAPKGAKAFNAARAFIREALKDGPMEAGKMHELAKERGLSYSSMMRAKNGIVTVWKDGANWMWRLAEAPE